MAKSIPDALQNIYESGIRGRNKGQTCCSEKTTIEVAVTKTNCECSKQTLLEQSPSVGVGATKITDIKELYLLSNNIRQSIVKMLHEAKSGHPAGAMGLADVFVCTLF